MNKTIVIAILMIALIAVFIIALDNTELASSRAVELSENKTKLDSVLKVLDTKIDSIVLLRTKLEVTEQVIALGISDGIESIQGLTKVVVNREGEEDAIQWIRNQ